MAEYGSYSAAAKGLFVAQSSLSQAVINLEGELGFPLLHRGRGGVTLTPMGDSVCSQAKELLAGVDKLRQRWQEDYQRRREVTGTVRIAAVPSAYSILTVWVLPRLQDGYPNLNIRLSEARNTILPSMLVQGQADLIVSNFIEPERQRMAVFVRDHRLALTELGCDEYKLAARATSRLAHKPTVPPQTAAKLSLACYSGRDPAAELFFRHGFDPANSLQLNSVERMLAAAENGTAVSVLPERSMLAILPRVRREALRFLTVDGLRAKVTYCAAARPNAASAPRVQAAMEEIRAAFGKAGEEVPVPNCVPYPKTEEGEQP